MQYFILGSGGFSGYARNKIPGNCDRDTLANRISNSQELYCNDKLNSLVIHTSRN